MAGAGARKGRVEIVEYSDLPMDYQRQTNPDGSLRFNGGSIAVHIIGVPFVGAEPRISAAVLGLAGLAPGDERMAKAAAAIRIPVEFVFQWDDELATREAGLAMYDAFASEEKSLHVNPGGHVERPAFEDASQEAFFLRHLRG